MSKQLFLLRDYQQETVRRVFQEWKTCRSVMVQMPTGTGKTHVLASVVNGISGTVLIVAHRIELVEQIRETVNGFRSFAGAQDDNINGQDVKINAQDDKIIRVASIQGIARRMDSLDFTPDLVVIDEAHHALAKTYRILWEKWPKAKFLGLTATPCRMNRSGFTDLFNRLVTSWSIAEFIERGVLSAFDYASIRANSADQRLIDSLEKRGADGDYQVKEMNEVLNRRPSIERLYRSMMQFAEGKKGIVYAISIDHARSIADYYSQQGVKAAAIDSRTPQQERKQLVEEFKAGGLQVLVNVDVFSEGFDCPDVEFVQMARPTLSLAKYLQQVGRGLRRTAGKETCMLIDNVGLYRVFGLPVVDWDWERMFRGETAGKGQRLIQNASETMYFPQWQVEVPGTDMGMGLVISHDRLLERLTELDKRPEIVLRTAELKAWQDEVTGLWGLRRGRERLTAAEYTTVFDIKEEQAAVRWPDNRCGLVDATGNKRWERSNCATMRFGRNRFLVVETAGGNTCYVDLCNLRTYEVKPEVKHFGSFELLKVKHTCYSRTQEVYQSSVDFDSLVITYRDYFLSINECNGQVYALFTNDEDYYPIYRWLDDGTLVVSDKEKRFYHATRERKSYLGNRTTPEEWKKCSDAIERLMEQTKSRIKKQEAEKKRQIQENFRTAIPYQVGLKWGLKVGNRITVPPIYRNVKPPVGKYCAVEMNYSQWGVISIDGTVLIEPKYPDITIENNGTALLTQVTGKKVTVKLK